MRKCKGAYGLHWMKRIIYNDLYIRHYVLILSRNAHNTLGVPTFYAGMFISNNTILNISRAIIDRLGTSVR